MQPGEKRVCTAAPLPRAARVREPARGCMLSAKVMLGRTRAARHRDDRGDRLGDAIPLSGQGGQITLRCPTNGSAEETAGPMDLQYGTTLVTVDNADGGAGTAATIVSNSASMRRTASSAIGEMNDGACPCALLRAFASTSARTKNLRRAWLQQAAS
mgnify:CR=1 FL=1